jgi:hypothetical protein
VAAGLAVLGRMPRRPILVATAVTAAWALPSATLAAGRPLPWVCAAAFVAGACSSVCGTYYATAIQRGVPAAVLGRVNAFDAFGAFVLGPLGLAAAGPVAALAGTGHVLGFGAAWQLAAVAAVLVVPAVRGHRPPAPHPATREPSEEPTGQPTEEPAPGPGESAATAPRRTRRAGG